MKTTDYIVLGLLNEGPLSGYDVRRLIRLRFAYFWQESYGQIYPALHRMEEKGWLKCDVQTVGKRVRNVYHMRPQGRAALKAWLLTPPQTYSMRIELLLKCYFSNLIERPILEGYVADFLQMQQGQMRQLQAFQAELMPLKGVDNHAQILMVIDLGLRYAQASIAWANAILEEKS